MRDVFAASKSQSSRAPAYSVWRQGRPTLCDSAMCQSKQPVYLIIPAYNRRAVTLSCLAALSEAGDLARNHVVVVDDGSTDGTSEAIRSQYPDVHVLPGSGELWWTGAIVLGMRYALAEGAQQIVWLKDRKSTRLNSSHSQISYAVFCLKKKKKKQNTTLR